MGGGAEGVQKFGRGLGDERGSHPICSQSIYFNVRLPLRSHILCPPYLPTLRRQLPTSFSHNLQTRRPQRSPMRPLHQSLPPPPPPLLLPAASIVMTRAGWRPAGGERRWWRRRGGWLRKLGEFWLRNRYQRTRWRRKTGAWSSPHPHRHHHLLLQWRNNWRLERASRTKRYSPPTGAGWRQRARQWIHRWIQLQIRQ